MPGSRGGAELHDPYPADQMTAGAGTHHAAPQMTLPPALTPTSRYRHLTPHGVSHASHQDDNQEPFPMAVLEPTFFVRRNPIPASELDADTFAISLEKAMFGRNIHVMRIEVLQWVIEAREGSGSNSRQFFPNRSEAIAAGAAKARQEKVDLIIHTRDGRIGRRKSFSNDLQDIKG